MPRNGSGTYIQPAGTAGVDGEVIYATPYNNLIGDIGNELTNSINVSGTKAMAAALPMGGNRIALMADPINPQDASTKNYVDNQISGKATTFIGGTTTGTASAQVLASVSPNTFTLTAGYRIVFTPGFTPTGATTLAVTSPAITAKNITKMSPLGLLPLGGGEMVAGQETEVLYDGTQYILLQNVAAETGPRTDLASAATTDLGTISSRNISITGTTAITSFGSTATPAFPIYFLTFVGSLRLTHSGTSLILPGAASIITQANDTAIALYLGGGNWQVVSYQVSAAAPSIWPPGAIVGLTLSQASTTTVGVDVGSCRNEDAGASRNMVLGSAMTKSLSGWAAGSGNGGLDTGSIAASTWYHVHLIRKDSDGSIDALLSLSATAPTMPAGYTSRRRIGSIRTNASSQVTPFSQSGDRFYWSVAVADVNANITSTAAQVVALSVPPNTEVDLQINATSSTTGFILISPTAVPDAAPSSSTAPLFTIGFTSAQSVGNSRSRYMVDASSQLRYRNTTATSTSVIIVTYGWLDTRGKN